MSGLADVDSTNWESQVMESKEPVLVDFWHDACIWCKRLEPELIEVAAEFPGVRFVRLNILSSDANGSIGEKYGVMGTPTLIFLFNGRVLQELVGYRPKDQLRQEVRTMVDNCKECFEQSTALKT